ncbi:DUF1028 domain-containing protein [Zavarzinia sp. CC-PAN008]|uniref:DUF1028 domain-containing protein n=1 Tax=Zavarzinia sp. CC-PAN008 TaxID=3243332 RepID=UPI003F744A3D
MTFSIVARCPATGSFGMAVSSSSPAVAARCAYARAGVGAVSTQNITDPTLGPKMLDLLALGADAQTAVDVAVASTPFADFRQLSAVDAQGRVATWSGARTLGTHATAHSTDAAAAGNLLANTNVPAAMLKSFHAAEGLLAVRLIKAMRAALDAGGEEGPVHSIGLKVVREVSWPIIDLRVDWSDDPVTALEALWAVYEPQVEPYVQRALDPASSPRYGVPGDK